MILWKEFLFIVYRILLEMVIMDVDCGMLYIKVSFLKFFLLLK